MHTRKEHSSRSLAMHLFDNPRKPEEVSSLLEGMYSYSLGNLIDAWTQCQERGIPFGRIATFKKWQSLGRLVRKGEKAIWLTVPRTIKSKEEGEEAREAEEKQRVLFMYVPRFFVEAQTDGAPLPKKSLFQKSPDELLSDLERSIEKNASALPRSLAVPAIALARASLSLPYATGEQKYFLQEATEAEARKILKLADLLVRDACDVKKRTTSEE